MTEQATLATVWAEADPMSMWRYDYPDRNMRWWEMPLFRVLLPVRKVLLRYIIVWHLLWTPRNTGTLAPWEQRGWRRWKTVLALLLPVPAVWAFPYGGDWVNGAWVKSKHDADAVLIWWGSDIGSTPSGLSWRAYYVGVGYGRCWHPFIWEEGE